MTEPASSGYDDASDAVDGTSGAAEGQERGSGPDAPLTTDDDAQRDDLPTRPGNEAG